MAEKDYRIERDSMGEVRVPKTAYYRATITICGPAGNFELNVTMPIVTLKLL